MTNGAIIQRTCFLFAASTFTCVYPSADERLQGALLLNFFQKLGQRGLGLDVAERG
jgi:hypothetical protein